LMGFSDLAKIWYDCCIFLWKTNARMKSCQVTFHLPLTVQSYARQ
jgi:hypothetical protein